MERAGRALFGPGFSNRDVSTGAWRARLKSVYRRRAMETHPDRAHALGRSEADLSCEFHSVSEAFRVLSALGGVDDHPFAPSEAGAQRPRSRGAPAHAPPPAEPRPRRDDGTGCADWPQRPRVLPRRRLRLAEFLYYSGRISFGAFVEAIVWQRRQRPAMGRIAVEFGFLTLSEVIEILQRRRGDDAFSVPFGEYAVRAGRLTPFQVLAILGAQHRRQRPIGEFFVECGLVRAGDVDALLRAMAAHNARYQR